MKYISTRSQAAALDFESVMLTGLAPDGGLYIPRSLPKFSQAEMHALRGLPYTELAFRIMHPFVDGCFDDHSLRETIERSYRTFDHPAITPLLQIDSNHFVLELFHGPTLAFKDIALQFLGSLLDHSLHKRQEKVVIIGATSGDTGSAAIEGCRHSEWVDIFIMHPYKRVSAIQRRQMTTVLTDNVYNIAIEGNFDDCQNLLKACFADQDFLKGRRLVAVNSINWARLMAQIVFYFYAALNLGAPDRRVSFAVPTGNFGDIFAGYLAKKMGLPIGKLLIATNANDILHRIASQGDFSKRDLVHSLSPSMDIVISSNFERLLFDLCDRQPDRLAALMKDAITGKATLTSEQIQCLQKYFISATADDEQTCATISKVYAETGYVLDPHTATAVHAVKKMRLSDTPFVTLATAHPAKFPAATARAGLETAALPSHLADLEQREERYEILANHLSTVQTHVRRQLAG